MLPAAGQGITLTLDTPAYSQLDSSWMPHASASADFVDDSIMTSHQIVALIRGVDICQMLQMFRVDFFTGTGTGSGPALVLTLAWLCLRAFVLPSARKLLGKHVACSMWHGKRSTLTLLYT